MTNGIAAVRPLAGARIQVAVRTRVEVLAALAALVIGVGCSVALLGAWSGASGVAGRSYASDGPSALLRLPAAAQNSISAALGREDAGYRIRGLAVDNPAQGFSARFSVAGATVVLGGHHFGISLQSVGRGTALRAVTALAPVVRDDRVVYSRPGVNEVWRNGPLGLEQTFVLTRRPAGTGQLELAVAMPAGARSLRAAIELPGGLRYGHLRAVDANGRVLPASMRMSHGQAILSVDDRDANYPVTIDPLVQQAQLSEAGGGTSGDGTGYSVAISGNTVVVGAPYVATGGKTDAGAAYVFNQGSSGWANMTQSATLTASDATAGDEFGRSVAISGSTIVVGAPIPSSGGDSTSTTPCPDPTGSAYVFKGSGTSWPQTAELLPNDGCSSSDFGLSVAIDGTTVAVGGPYQQLSNSQPQGAAFVYTLNSAGAQTGSEAIINAGSEGQDDDALFGYSVAVSGSTLVVGAPTQLDMGGYTAPGRAYIFTMPGGGWTSTTTATSTLVSSDDGTVDDFGYSVAASGSTVVVGAPYATPGGTAANNQEGAVYVFEQPSGGWPANMEQNSELTASDPQGDAGFNLGLGGVAIDGQTIVAGPGVDAGSGDTGAAYVFTEPSSGWPTTMSQTQELLQTTPQHGTGFGQAVAISGTTAVVGAYQQDPGGPSTPPQSGAAYIFGSQASTTTTTTTTMTTPTTGTGSSYHAAVSADKVSVKAACAGASGTSCQLKFSLTSRETLKRGKAAAVAASVRSRKKKKGKIVRTVSIGSVSGTLAGGASKTFKLTLNATGRKLLAKFKVLPAELTITQIVSTKATVTSTQKVTFHAAKKKKKK